MDPRIGVLNRAGRPVFYAFVDGYDKPAAEGSLGDVEAALGLRAAIAAPGKPRVLREFSVTVTPRVVTYAGSAVLGEYAVTVFAESAAKAISAARRMRRDEEGAHAVPAVFRARRVRS